MGACSSNVSVLASGKSSKGTLLGAPEHVLLPTDVGPKATSSEELDQTAATPAALEKLESPPPAAEVNTEVATVELEGVTEEVKAEVPAACYSEAWAQFAGDLLAQEKDQQGTDETIPAAPEVVETTPPGELTKEADTRYDFGPGFFTKCSTCRAFTKNRGDEDTKTIYCIRCYRSGSSLELQTDDPTAPLLPEGAEAAVPLDDVRTEEVAPEADEANPAEKPMPAVEMNTADESKSAEDPKVDEAPPSEEPKPAEQSTLARWTHRLQRSMGLTKESLQRNPEEAVHRAEEVGSAEMPTPTVEASLSEELKAEEHLCIEKPTLESAKPADEAKAPVDASWIQATLTAHNNLRAIHGAPPLEWSDECWTSAKKAAENCTKIGKLEHTHCEGPSGAHGQNGFGGSGGSYKPEQAVQPWYDELKDYDFANHGFAGNTGHFTQVVWVDSTKVGLASSDDGCYIFANYYPAGNLQGAFEKNVGPVDQAMKQRSDERLAEALAASGKKQLRGLKTMTPELKEIIDMAIEQSGIDDTWLRACNAAFEAGGSVDCDFDPKGDSKDSPYMKLMMSDGIMWQHPC